MATPSWADQVELEREGRPPDPGGPGGGGEEEGAVGGAVGGVPGDSGNASTSGNASGNGGMETGTRPKKKNDETPVGVSTDNGGDSSDDNVGSVTMSEKVKDLRDPRNLPALGSAMNYARAVANQSQQARSNEVKDTYTLTLELVSFNNSRNYTMNHDELAKLLFERIRIPGGECIVGFDANEQQYIHLEIDARVPKETLNLTDSFMIRQGLRMNPIRPVVSDTLVKLFWTPMGMDNNEIKKVLSLFGTVTSEVEYTTFKIRKDAPAATKELEKIKKCSDREVRMKLETAIPPNIRVSGRKIRVWHHRMKKQCFWCLQLEDKCNFEADGKACKAASPNDQANWDEFWEEVVKNLTNDPIEPMTEDYQLGQSTAKLMVGSNFPKDVTVEEVAEFFGSHGIEIDPEECVITSLPESARVTFKIDHLDQESKSWMMINANRKKIREKRIYIQPLVDLTPQKTNDAAKAAGNANQKTKEVTKITEEQQRIIDEKKRLFKKSKEDLEKQAGRSLSNKETKNLRKSLAPALDKIHEVTEIPDTPVPGDEKEGSFVTSPTRRRNSKSKGVTLPISTFRTADIEIPYTPSKLKLPGDTLYGSLEHQLELIKQMKKKEGNSSDDGEEASKDSDSGDADERLKLGSSGSTLEPGQLLQLSDDSIPLYNLSDTSVSQSKEDNDEDPGTEDSEADDDKESNVSKDFDTLAEATLGDVSPKSVNKLVNQFEDHMKGRNKRGRGNSTTPESKSGSPPLTKKQAKKARQRQRRQSEKNSGISEANVMLTKEFFMKADDFPSLDSPKK